MEVRENQTKSSSIKELLDNFAKYSTLNGLHFLVDASSYIRKLIWFFLLCGATSFFVYLAYQGWAKWKKNEVFITTEIKINDVGSAAFPAVTICNRNMMKKSKILGTDSQRYLDALDHELSHKRPAIENQMNQPFNIEQAVHEHGHLLEDMVKSCHVGVTWLPCTFSHSLHFSSGLCYTFNSNGTYKPIRKGSSFGLSLLLDAEPEEYYGPYSRSGVGFRIIVHEKDDKPTVELDGWDVPTGFATNFILKRKEIIRQPSPYPSECVDIQLQTTKLYSENSCFLEKYTNKTVDKCQCRILGMPVVGGIDSCKVKRISGEKSKMFCSVQQIWSCALPIVQNFDSKECFPPCKEVKYDIKKSSLIFPSGDALDKASDDIKKMYESSNTTNKSFHDWYRSRFALVKVFFYSSDTKIVREVPAYEFVDFAAGFGGNMGLLLGCSVLTVAEFIDLFVLVIIEWYRNYRRKIHIAPASCERGSSLQDERH